VFKLNHILNQINVCWKQTLEKIKNITQNKINNIDSNKSKFTLIQIFTVNNGYLHSIIDNKNAQELYDIYLNLGLIYDGINNKEFSKNTIIDIKDNEIFNLIFTIFYNEIKNLILFDLKSKFEGYYGNNCIEGYYGNQYIDWNILEKLDYYNINVKINKILLFKFQIEKSVKKIYKLHQVENYSLFELEVNKMMELLINKMIGMTDNDWNDR
jgi:hypothetical protein